MHQYDIIIVGSGIVGSVTALLLAQNTSLKVAILESQAAAAAWNSDCYDHRVSAISLSSRRILQNVDVWNAIQNKRITPYTHMHVWDEGGAGHIDFDCREVQEPVLGYIIEDSVMRTSLQEKIIQIATIDFIRPVKLQTLQQAAQGVELIAADGETYAAQLLIAADGANSWVREQLQVAMKSYDYEQTAIVATVQTTASHQYTAWQRFLNTGPLAFLPLANDKTCSIVWSATHDVAHELLQLDDATFCARLNEAAQKKLGEVIHISKRFSFPLRMRHVKNYVQDHIALLGDAAHTIHPLAGQGMNMGLLDAACLAEVIINAKEKNRAYASFATLRKYERWRKSDNAILLTGVNLLKQLFIQQNSTIKQLRNTGLDLVNRLTHIKNLFADYALGNRSDLPDLAKHQQTIFF